MTRNYKATELRQKQIAEAAAKIIIKYGSEHVTIKKIAKEVGISETAIYRHFKSKQAFLSFLIDDIEKTLLSEIEIYNPIGPYTLETLEITIKKHMSRVIQRKGISFQIIDEIISFGNKKLNNQVFSAIEKYTGRIKEILEKGRVSGVIKPEVDLEAAAIIFFGMTQGLVNIWTLSQYNFNLGEKYAATWNVFRDAIIKI
jgi:TetR/AcrR family transcriptional regulator, fatty acid metabolism regulator protein